MKFSKNEKNLRILFSNKKADLRKVVEIVLIAVFLLVFITLLVPGGQFDDLKDKTMDILKKNVPNFDNDVDKPDQNMPKDLSTSFQEFESVLEQGKENQNTNCIIYFKQFSNFDGWKIDLIQGDQKIALTPLNKIGQSMLDQRKTVDKLKLCTGDPTSQTDHQQIIITEKDKLESEGNKYTFSSNSLELSSGEKITALYKKDQEHICFLTSGNTEALLPTGKTPIDLCYQDECDFIKTCQDIKNQDKCQSSPCSLSCAWERAHFLSFGKSCVSS